MEQVPNYSFWKDIGNLTAVSKFSRTVLAYTLIIKNTLPTLEVGPFQDYTTFIFRMAVISSADLGADILIKNNTEVSEMTSWKPMTRRSKVSVTKTFCRCDSDIC